MIQEKTQRPAVTTKVLALGLVLATLLAAASLMLAAKPALPKSTQPS
jgi:hypothetical protein